MEDSQNQQLEGSMLTTARCLRPMKADAHAPSNSPAFEHHTREHGLVLAVEVGKYGIIFASLFVQNTFQADLKDPNPDSSKI